MMKWIAVLLLTLPAFGQSQLGGYPTTSSGSGSQRVLYTSQIIGTTTDVVVAPLSSAVGNTGRAAAINAAIANGNVKLIHDVSVGLEAPLTLYSNTTVECLPGKGFIMNPSSNAELIRNAHLNAPTTVNGNGYDVSNQADAHIAIRNCILNANAIEAETGTDFTGVAHKANPNNSNNLVWGVNFSGIDDFWFEGNELYDTATIAVSMANMSRAHVNDNYIHQPTPLVMNKNTDGIHFYGPSTYLYVNNNRIHGDDDAIALNADDVSRPCEGSTPSISTYTYLKWGPITNVWANGNHFDNSMAGYRLYSVDSLIDNINLSNTSGTTLGEASNITRAMGGSCTGNVGNVGRVAIDGWHVASNGSNAMFYMNADLYITSNIDTLLFNRAQLDEPASTWPMIYQNVGTIRNLGLSNSQVKTQTVDKHCLVRSQGTINNVNFVNNAWDDVATRIGTFFCGNPPTSMTASGYLGPNRMVPANIAVPGTVTPAGSTTGGTLPAASYYYVVTALNSKGETTASPEANVTTTGTTSSVALTWAAVPSANSYRVYRGTTAGGESVYYTTTTNSYTDTNATSTGGTAPTFNSTGYGVAYKSGDAFSNSYPATTNIPYLSTDFSEGFSAATLNGTYPSICLNGCKGSWGAAAGFAFSPSSLNYPNGVAHTGALAGTTATYSVPTQDWAVMDAGAANFVERLTVSGSTLNNTQLMLRYTDISNYVAININNNAATVYDCVSGSCSSKGTASGNYLNGNFTITANGSTITLALPGQPTVTATGITNTSATKLGFSVYNAASSVLFSNLEVSSQ